MNTGFIYTRWLLSLTLFTLIGLLAVGMMTVHSKRTIRALAVDLNAKEAELEELGRRQNSLDTDLASSLNPEYLKELILMSNLRLGPPREEQIIVVPALDSRFKPAGIRSSGEGVAPDPYRSRLELAHNETEEQD